MVPFTVVDIPLDAREDTEQLGSKPKFWVLLDGHRWLFKEARVGTGEDWAEKVVAELAKELQINVAVVELAAYDGRRGSISRNFIDVAAGEALVHGNELLGWAVTGYDKSKTFRQSDHTLENLVAAIHGIFPAEIAEGILTQLAGYIVLDALVSNTDRHHENWGLKLRTETAPRQLILEVAPSFDHASSLGRELLDARRLELLSQNRVGWYVGKGKGGIFRTADAKHGENPLRLVQVAARAYPSYFTPALGKVAALSPRTIHQIVNLIPDERASDMAKEFAEAMILFAQFSLNEIFK